MKKINLIEWLSRNSHEKQKPQRFARYAAMLIMLLTIGVGQMWASISGGVTVYLNVDNCSNWRESTPRFAIVVQADGKADQWASMTATGGPSNTYYATIPSGTWKKMFFCRMNGDGSHNDNKWENRWNQSSELTSLDAGNCYTVSNGWDNSGGNWNYISLSSKTVYFDIRNVTDWTTSYIRIGRTDYNAASSALSLVSGTKYLYSISALNWANYAAYSIANHTGSTGGSTIYQPTSSGSISKQTVFQNANIVTNVYIQPGSIKNTENGCDYYTVTTQNSLPTYTVSYSTSGTGTGTLSVTKYNGSTYDAFSSGGSVNPTQIMKIVASPDDGNALSLSISGATRIGDTDTYYVTANTTITATFTPEETHNVTVYYKCGGSSIGAGSATESNVGVTTTRSITAPDITGYRFSSWSVGTHVKASSTSSATIDINSKTCSSDCDFTITANYTAKTLIKLYYDNPNEWTGIKAYVWENTNGSNHNATWAGDPITGNTLVRNCKTYYYFSYYTDASDDNKNWDRIIFSDASNDGNKTGDITFSKSTDNNKYWDGDSWESLPAEVSYTVTVNTESVSKGTVSPTSGTANNVGCALGIEASPTTYYIFDHWTADANTAVASTTTNPTTVTATNNGTVTAYFNDKWCATGSGTAGMGNWSTSVNGLTYTSGTTVRGKVSITAKGDYTFKIKDRSAASDKGWYANGETISRASNSTTTDLSTSGDNMTFKADVAGDYYFAYDVDGKDLTVTYPTAYAVSYETVLFSGSGTACSAPSAETSASLAVTSRDMVLDGSTVTFTAEAANTGYTFRGWFNTASPTIGTTTPLSSNEDADGNIYTYTTTVSDAAVTVYAIYTEDMHTVTVTVDSHGTITTPASGTPRTVQAGISTSASIEASAVYGYYFKEWTVESGTASFGNKDNASTTVNATEDVTILANFVSHWTIAGGDTDEADGVDAMGDWNTLANGIDNFEEVETGVYVGHVDINLPANSTFKFKVRDLYDGSAWYGNTGTMTYDNSTNWLMTTDAGKNCGITTAGKGSYRFTWNEKTKYLTVTYPRSWTVDYGVMTSYNGGASSDASTTGGSITSVVDGDDIALTSGKYVVNGGSVTVVAAPEDGYEIAGWYSDAACTSAYTSGEGGVIISGEGNTNFTITSLAANTGIYVKFAEKMTTVNFAHNEHGHVEISSTTKTSANVGVHTTYTLTPVADWGYYFAGWEKTAGTEYATTGAVDDEDNTAPTLSGNGNTVTSGQTLTAKFVELEKVYLYNMGWGETLDHLWPIDGDNHIYAYFAVQEESSCPKSANTDDPYYIQQMAQENISTMYAYVPRAVTRNLNAGTYGNNERIAFSNHQFEKNYKFHQYEAIYWGSYRQIINEFVPQVNDYKTLNETKVYNGYWKRHDAKIGDEAGYYLKHRTGTNTYSDFTNGTDPIFKYISDNQIQCKLRIDNSEDANNYYMIHSAGGVKYTTAEWPQDATAPDITSANCLNVGITENQINDSKFLIKQTSQGYYTLTMTFSSDTMYLKVDYPVAVGDYRLEHSYTVDAVTKKTYSGVLKHDDDDKAALTSMYLNMDAGTKSLKMQTCTSIDGTGHPVWSSGVDVTGFNTTNFKDGKGVYRFRISWVGNAAGSDVTSATPDIIALYDGEYYIKTDYALGGWTNWIMNNMEKNTINFRKENPKTFDYYYPVWVSEETGDRNVKCVVGNIYNEALCDTLVGDEILGLDGGNPREYLAYDASVRFSYNSYTNELKRAYLNGSNDGTTDYMYLQGTSESTSRILNKDTHAAFTDNKVKFKDRGNWIYEIDIEAEEGARVKLISNYRFSNADHLQYLKGSDGEWGTSTTSQILGGSNNTTAHLIRVVYDFKTNHLISAWLAGGEEGATRAINTNAMIIREHQEQANQITFSDESYKLTEVDTVYSVMKFNKWTINNKSKESGHAALYPAKSQHERDLFWISFPYDVKLSDVFGFGDYMKHWGIMYYDGRGRAKNGFWAESETNWKFIPASKKDTILHAFEGYVLALDLDLLGESSKVWQLVEDVYLYFPSNGPAGSIVQQDTTVAIDTVGYHCNIDRYHKNDGSGETTGLPASYDRRYRDSHWHCIGVPSFHDVSHDIAHNSGEDPEQPWTDGDEDSKVDMPNPDRYTLPEWETLEVPYFYEWNMTDNKLYAKSNTADFTFKAMYSYMVQYANDHITWSAVTISPKPASVVERRKAKMADDQFLEFNLHIMREDKSLDNTYVRLTDNENVTADFEFGQDMCKEFQSSSSTSIYTIIDELEVAGNSLPLSDQTTIVPVGVKIAANGLYTFSMPEGTEGIGVVLIDNIAGTRTNLGLTDYEVSLTQGKIDNRFWLEISPISQVHTGIEPISGGKDDEVRKVIVDQQMYIIRNNEIFDAQGRQVK